MISKNKMIAYLLIASLLGITAGYLFSAKFCTVSISNRVENKLNLNQITRALFAKQVLLTFEYLRSLIFNISDTSISKELKTNKEAIVHLINSYYGKIPAEKLNILLDQKNSLLCSLIANKDPVLENKINTQWNRNTKELQEWFMQLNTTQPSDSMLTTSTVDLQNTLLLQAKKALQEKNWDLVWQLFEKQFENAMQLADEINHGIIKQFPGKF